MLVERDSVPTNSKPTKELVPQTLTLRNGRQPAVLHLLGVQLKRVFGELEAFLDEGGEFADSAALLAEDFLGVRGADNDLTWPHGDCKSLERRG